MKSGSDPISGQTNLMVNPSSSIPGHGVHRLSHESLPVGMLLVVRQEEARVRLRRQRLVRGLLGVNSIGLMLATSF